MEYILETMGLTKIYGQKAAVNDVSLHIPEGVIYGLIGRNGAGKTTIMRMISGLATPTKGSYSLFGKTGYAMGKELKNVGVLIENPGLYPRFSAYDNLKIKCLGMGINPKGYVEQLLETVGLENVDRKKGAGSFSSVCASVWASVWPWWAIRKCSCSTNPSTVWIPRVLSKCVRRWSVSGMKERSPS